ncbi:hypothetical protein [Dyella koreensis]|uniref:P-type DNA transfer protein VirB5 n=1 Tax=Dyella koreensis TaxID=311235 RepID=A0ABW8K1V7_9GAMM
MKTSTSRRASRRKGLIAGLMLACSLFTGSGQAQLGVIVNDPESMGKAIAEYAEQAKRWIDTVQQYKATIDHYTAQVAFWQEQLVKLQSLNFTLFTMQNQFKKIPADYGVKDACPGVTGGLAGDITTALQSFLPNMGGDVVKQQRDLCQLIVLTKNQKYNDTVDYLQSTAQESDRFYQIQAQRMSTAKSPGDLEANSNELSQFQGRIVKNQADWSSKMTTLDTQIQMLQQMQGILSRRAMNGSPSPLGTLVNTAAMKAAFSQ